MGRLFDGLVKTGLETQDASAPGGKRDVFYDTPEETMAAANESLQRGMVPWVNPQTGETVGGQPTMPTVVNPSFEEATTDQYGNIRAKSPGLTKMGWLVKLLKGGLQGAADAAAGGALDYNPYRSSFGRGLGAAMYQGPAQRRWNVMQQRQSDFQQQEQQAKIAALPWLLRKSRADVEHLEAETEAARQHANYWRTAAGQKDQQDLHHLYAAAVEAGDTEKANRYADAIREIQREPAGKNQTPFSAWRAANPDAPISDWYDLRNASEAKYRRPEKPEKPQHATPYQFSQIEDEYQTELQDAEEEFRNPKYTDPTILKNGEEQDNPHFVLYEDRLAKLERKKAAAEEKYKKNIVAAGGSVDGGKPLKSQARRVGRNPQTGENAYLIGNRWYFEHEVDSGPDADTGAAHTQYNYYQGHRYRRQGDKWILDEVR